MVIDNIKNRKKYYCLGKDIQAVLDYFASVSDKKFDKEDLKVPSTDILVKSRPMMTKSVGESSFEAHKKYIDIHFLTYGIEGIGYADISTLTKTSKYDEEKDVYSLKGEGDILTMRAGYFMITFPEDAHMPGISIGEPNKIGKMIAKIKI